MIGDRSYGVFNLRILNASLDDDAEFQCQVGPAKNSAPIRTAANLTVICKYQYREPPSILKTLWMIKLCKHSTLSYAVRAWCDLCKQDPLSTSQVDVYTQAGHLKNNSYKRQQTLSAVCECVLLTGLTFLPNINKTKRKSPNILFVQRSDL